MQKSHKFTFPNSWWEPANTQEVKSLDVHIRHCFLDEDDLNEPTACMQTLLMHVHWLIYMGVRVWVVFPSQTVYHSVIL